MTMNVLDKHDRGWIVPKEDRVQPKAEMGRPALWDDMDIPPCFILHSTECSTGDSQAEMKHWWADFENAPHLALKLESQTFAGHDKFEYLVQIYSFEQEARALWHPSVHTHGLSAKERELIAKDSDDGIHSPQTNGMGYVAQMEVVGFAKHLGDLSDSDLKKIAEPIRAWRHWVQDTFTHFPNFKAGEPFKVVPYKIDQPVPGSYGMFGVNRMDKQEWKTRLKKDGQPWSLGQHSNAPWQRHWDANLNVAKIAAYANIDSLPTATAV